MANNLSAQAQVNSMSAQAWQVGIADHEQKNLLIFGLN
jgi:hypothetical protein